MILDSPTKKYEIVLGTAKTTTDMPVCISFVDEPAGITGSFDTQTNGITAVPFLTGAELRTKRTVKEVTVFNVDTVAKSVTIHLNNNGTIRNILTWIMQVGDVLGYTDYAGWYLADSSGQRKMSMPGYALVAGSATQTFSVAPATAAAHAVQMGQLDAGTGHIGEILEVGQGGTNVPASTVYGDLGSISISAGTWDISCFVYIYNSSAGNATAGYIGIGTAAGANAAGVIGGDTRADFPPIVSGTSISACVPPRRFVFASATTLYFKCSLSYSGGTTPSAAGRLTAVRVAL